MNRLVLTSSIDPCPQFGRRRAGARRPIFSPILSQNGKFPFLEIPFLEIFPFLANFRNLFICQDLKFLSNSLQFLLV